MSLTSYQAAPPRGRIEKYAFGCEAQELFTVITGFALPFSNGSSAMNESFREPLLKKSRGEPFALTTMPS